MKKSDLIQAQAKAKFRKAPSEIRFLKAALVGLIITLAFGVLLAIFDGA